MNEDAGRQESASSGTDGAERDDVTAQPPDPERDESSQTPPEEDTAVSKDARLRVLRLVAEGRLSVDEAEQLLAAMEDDAATEDAGAEQRDVFFHFGPGAMPFTVPVPPVPPMPPMAPMPPLPPRWGAGPIPGPGDVVMYKRGARDRGPRRIMAAMGPGGPQIVRGPGRGGAPKQTLVVHTQEGDTETHTRIPLVAAANAEAFLPKQARAHLATCEIDIKAVGSSVAELAHSPYPSDEPLVQIQEGETEVRISLE